MAETKYIIEWFSIQLIVRIINDVPNLPFIPFPRKNAHRFIIV